MIILSYITRRTLDQYFLRPNPLSDKRIRERERERLGIRENWYTGEIFPDIALRFNFGGHFVFQVFELVACGYLAFEMKANFDDFCLSNGSQLEIIRHQ